MLSGWRVAATPLCPPVAARCDVMRRLLMGTRSGDLDPAVVLHLQNTLKLSPKDTDTLLNKKSGKPATPHPPPPHTHTQKCQSPEETSSGRRRLNKADIIR